MKKMKMALLAGAATIALASSASASDTALTLWNSTNPSGAITAIGTTTATLSGANLGGITITTSSVLRETVPNNGMTESNLFITNTDSSAQVLDIIAGTNGFLGPNNLFNASATVLIGTGQADLIGSFFVDALDNLNGTGVGGPTGTNIGSFDSGLLTGPFSFSSNSADVFFPVSGPYGMAEELQLTLQPGAFVGVQSISMDATTAVPEPKTWAMLGIGFAMLSLVGLKRKRDRVAFSA